MDVQWLGTAAGAAALSVVSMFAFHCFITHVSFVLYSFLSTAVRADFVCLSVPANHLLFCCILHFYWQIDLI